jgi:hypothetical protein
MSLVASAAAPMDGGMVGGREGEMVNNPSGRHVKRKDARWRDEGREGRREGGRAYLPERMAPCTAAP